MQCPVLAVAQLSRAVEQRPDKRPLLSDLRESGQIEADADCVLMLYRDDYYDRDSERPGEMDVIERRNRQGRLGQVTTRIDQRLRLPPGACRAGGRHRAVLKDRRGGGEGRRSRGPCATGTRPP
jgi:DnaB-like helicase C terminal domain